MNLVNPKAVLLAGVLTITALQAEICTPNLLANPGFEQSHTGWKLAGAQVVADAHSGSASLRYQNSAPERYHTFSQLLNVKPGQAIDFGGWVKSRDVLGFAQDQGASIYLQSFDRQGRFLEGSYPPGITGDSGWQPIGAVYTVPERAARTTLGVYLRKGTTGTAWFDDLYACIRPAQPRIYQWADPQQRVVTTLIEVAQPQRVQLESTLLTRDGVVVKATRQHYWIEQPQRVSFRLPEGLAPAEYRLHQRVVELVTRRQHSSDLLLQIGQPAASVALDGQGFVLRGGKRFFPLGIYANMTQDRHLSRIAAAGFNTVLNYNYGSGKDPYAFFRQADKHGLQVIYSVKDLYPGTRFAPPTRHSYPALTQWMVERLRDRPNLLAWYINDELGQEYITQIEQKNWQIKRLDRNHPTFQVLNRTGYLNAYFNSSDILATDPYPVGVDPDLTRSGDYARLTTQAARGVKGAWVVIQIMDHAAYDSRRKAHQPSQQEIRNQVWQALIGGAQGLLFYSYTDLFYKQKNGQFSQQEFDGIWHDVAAVAQQIGEFKPYLLSGQSQLLTGDNTEVAARLFMHGDRGLLMLVNPYYKPVSTRFVLPMGWVWRGDQQITANLPSIGSNVIWLHRQEKTVP